MNAMCRNTAWLLALFGAVLCMQSRAAGTGEPRLRDDDYRSWSGRQIIEETVTRHQQFPYVYEEQTMVLMDAGSNRTVRKLRRFSRAGEDGSFKLLLVFDDPEEIRGVSLLAIRFGDGRVERGVYLPAFGAELKRPRGSGANGNFLGTDFAVEDLTAEDTAEYRYVRGSDRMIEEVGFFVVDAYPRDAEVERSHGYGLRRHLVRKDNFVIAQTDFFDRRLRFLKRLTRHDLRQVDGPSWRANMLIVNDELDNHRTLLKVNRRVYSRDYVPDAIFDPAFLMSPDGSGGLAARGE
jgi:hypothetical protein